MTSTLRDAPTDVAELYPQAGTWTRKFPWRRQSRAAYGAIYSTDLDGKPIERRVTIDQAIMNDATAALWAIGEALSRQVRKSSRRRRNTRP